METQTNLSFPEQCHKLGYVSGNIVIDATYLDIEKLRREKEMKENERE